MSTCSSCGLPLSPAVFMTVTSSPSDFRRLLFSSSEPQKSSAVLGVLFEVRGNESRISMRCSSSDWSDSPVDQRHACQRPGWPSADKTGEKREHEEELLKGRSPQMRPRSI